MTWAVDQRLVMRAAQTANCFNNFWNLHTFFTLLTAFHNSPARTSKTGDYLWSTAKSILRGNPINMVWNNETTMTDEIALHLWIIFGLNPEDFNAGPNDFFWIRHSCNAKEGPVFVLEYGFYLNVYFKVWAHGVFHQENVELWIWPHPRVIFMQTELFRLKAQLLVMLNVLWRVSGRAQLPSSTVKWS